jgi:hypothetical protein
MHGHLACASHRRPPTIGSSSRYISSATRCKPEQAGLRGKRSVGASLAVAAASGSCLQTQQACHCYEMIRTEYSRLVPLRDRR